MSELKAMQCEACRADAPKVSDAELPELMRQIPIGRPSCAMVFYSWNVSLNLKTSNRPGRIAIRSPGWQKKKAIIRRYCSSGAS